MSINYNLSKTEHEIMMVLWKIQKPIKTRELLDLFNEKGKDWKRQTLNTLLARLENKNLINRTGNMIEPIYTEQEYKQLQSQNVLDEMYEGKISNFLVALTGKERISKEYEEELFNLIENLKKGE